MIARELLHCCANARVAHAAVYSIGGDFVASFAVQASRQKMSAGELAASAFENFSATAIEAEWAGLVAATRNCDQPILSGLRRILTGWALKRDLAWAESGMF